MLRFFSYLLVLCIGAGSAGFGVLYIANKKTSSLAEWSARQELETAAAGVQKRMQALREELAARQRGFGAAVAADRGFSVKLFVEQDSAAPEVTDIASGYRKAMNFDLLSIVDGSGRILSCGQFPGAAGSSLAVLPPSADFTPLRDQLGGREVLTLQARSDFSVSGIVLCAVGGIVLDHAFFAGLSPSADIPLIVRCGDELFGMDKVKTISEFREGRIYIDNAPWLATPVDLGLGAGYASWLVVREPPALDLKALLQ